MSELTQVPAPGGHTLHYRGDTITITLENRSGRKGKAWLRSNIGYADVRNAEIILHAEKGLPPLARDWHDFPMEPAGRNAYSITLPLLGVGRFEAKAYFVEDKTGKMLWPDGGNAVLKVEPAETCAGNTMYTAFVRQFGEVRFKGAVAPEHEAPVRQLDEAGYAVIPRGGRFRDLIQELDFIVGTLRCKIVQLLPIHPTPTTYARMGRFGSPFAVMDLLDVDPALAEFDQRTTPLDQFQELVDEVHRRNARIYLDMPINHTGWASHLQVTHPEWFHHNEDGSFMSPGAWGITWEDLSNLDYAHHGLWMYMAGVFLFWCRKGVDGFRCDAGYKVPFEAWEYIIAKVRTEYPDTIFLLEGLGGYKHVTEHLLADSGMNWAYSEIFQNHDQGQVDGYLPESIRVSESKGNLIHFAETHDNLRLAATSHAFARLRTAFCALTCHNGAFGFANGVEWFATEKVNVHNAHSLNWGAKTNQIAFIRRIHAIMEAHPCFHHGTQVRLVTDGYHNAAAVLRSDRASANRLLILANLNPESPTMVRWHGDMAAFTTDLLSGKQMHHDATSCPLDPGQVLCLSDDANWLGPVDALLATPFHGAARSEEQCLQAKAMDVYAHFDALDRFDINALMENPKRLCETLADNAPLVTAWQWPRDTHRTAMLPPCHFLLVQSNDGFIAELISATGETLAHEKSLIRKNGQFFALFLPLPAPARHQTIILKMTVFDPGGIRHAESPLMQLPEAGNAMVETTFQAGEVHDRDRYAICTNHHGALAQVRIAWADLRSKYDSLLSANLDPAVPVDRHTMLTRCRAWIVRKGYSHELSLSCQKRFTVADDGTVLWDFAVPVGEGLLVPLRVSLRMHPESNAIELGFLRAAAGGDPEHLADEESVELILRPDIEDRCNHGVTKAYTGPEADWPRALDAYENGFRFSPAPDRVLEVSVDQGRYNPEPEWYYMVEHSIDRERCTDGASDLFSPGYFRIDLPGNTLRQLVAGINGIPAFSKRSNAAARPEVPMLEAMQLAMKQFIVKRDQFQTVIAGYPWFLDWGRDTLISLRGIIAAGMLEEATNILLQFAKFERGGTIPNMIRGNDDNNRETSDAPLWLFVACNELIAAQGNQELLKKKCGTRTLKQVLVSLAKGLMAGTDNGIAFDEETGLLFSPAHFTWMDTNYPAATPRQGYPVEIQALWHYALDMLADIDRKGDWRSRAERVEQSIEQLYVVHDGELTYLADCLAAAPGTGARAADADDALRPNQLLAVTLGAIKNPNLRRSIVEACEQLLVPGGIRSLADRPVRRPAPVYIQGQLMNDPNHPYWGQYTGDEDTRRKTAYHNGTAWTWLFPSYAEALVQACGENAVPTAMAILESAIHVVNRGCMRQVPEIVDGNTPHRQRGCGAQAWGATELYRVGHDIMNAMSKCL